MRFSKAILVTALFFSSIAESQNLSTEYLQKKLIKLADAYPAVNREWYRLTEQYGRDEAAVVRASMNSGRDSLRNDLEGVCRQLSDRYRNQPFKLSDEAKDAADLHCTGLIAEVARKR